MKKMHEGSNTDNTAVLGTVLLFVFVMALITMIGLPATTPNDLVMLGQSNIENTGVISNEVSETFPLNTNISSVNLAQ
mgnify:CR=1 FL=1|jgi:hypothetical protein